LKGLKVTKQALVAQIKRIEEMTLSEVNKYQIGISMSNADRKAKGFLYKACERQLENIGIRRNAMVTNGDMSYFSKKEQYGE